MSTPSPMTDQERLLIREHLEELLALPEFVRAQVQARALVAMVQGSLDGRSLTGRDIAQAVYGRTEEGYLRAIRQVKRELRFKLLRHYAEAPSGPVRFDVTEEQYTVALLFTPSPALDGGPTVRVDRETAGGALLESFPPVERPRKRQALLIPAIAIAMTLGLVAVATRGFRATLPVDVALPQKTEVHGERLVVVGPTGEELAEWTERLPRVSGVPVDMPHSRFHATARVAIAGIPGRAGEQDRVAVLGCEPERVDGCELRLLDAVSGRVVESLAVPVLDPDKPRPTRLHAPEDGDFELAFFARQLQPVELDGDGRSDELLIVLRHARLFPSQILAIEPGPPLRVMAEFWSMGHVEVSALPDLDGDGADELVAHGERNAEQIGFAWILPPIPASRGVRGRTPDGRRPVVIDEMRGLPVVGITLAFPSSPLSRPEFAEIYLLRGTVRKVLWDPSARVLHFEVEDAVWKPDANRAARMAFDFDLKNRAVNTQLLDYDFYLVELQRRLLPAGPIEDQWHLRQTESLAGLGRELAASVRMAVAEGGAAVWQPLDLAAVERRFPRGSRAEAPSAANPEAGEGMSRAPR